mgnify:CR=1 FL=1
MKTKRVSVILIAVAFLAISILSCINMFSLKSIRVNYSVSDNADTNSIQAKLDTFIGRNLLFLDESELLSVLWDEPYMEITSVNKSYPNVLNISIKERREVYYFQLDEKLYVLSEEGYVLNCLEGQVALDALNSNLRDKITLKLDGIEVYGLIIGAKIKTDSDELLKSVFDMTKKVDLTDCIKAITVNKGIEIEGDALFETYTGVKICVEKCYDDGLEKIEKAFIAYDTLITDYQKTYGVIQVYKMDDGNIRITYEQRELDYDEGGN